MSFKRITCNEVKVDTLKEFFDEIRMRDAVNHPRAYIKYGKFILEFSRAALRPDSIEADVRITCEY